jgi:hypothetical protein
VRQPARLHGTAIRRPPALRLLALAVLTALVAAGAALWLRRRPAPLAPVPSLVAYNAITGDLSLVDAPATATAARRTLPCGQLGRWAVRVGIHDDQLVALETLTRQIEVVPLEQLRRIRAGRERCEAAASIARRVPLHAGKIPYRGHVDGGRLYVSYFADNLVEVYRWPALTWERDIRFEASENLGLSDLQVADGALLVAATGYFCFARDCTGRLHAPHLFSVSPGARWPFPEARPANANASGLYRHPPNGARYLINSGEYSRGYGSLQRILPGPALGPELRLPTNSAPALAVPLSATRFAVLPFTGDHLYVVDAAADRLVAALHLDGTRFERVDPAQPISDRAAADLQELLAVPGSTDRFLLLDAKNDRLLQLRHHAADDTLEVTGTVSLATGAYRSGPQWAFWLP